MNVHFIAIGGSVMHNLAIALRKLGHNVSGSDDEIFEPARSRLDENDLLPPAEGWDPSKVNSTLDAVILGMHAHPDNPELKAAQDQGVRIYSFPEFIYESARDKKRVVIGGSHGKTTLTSMIMYALQQLGIAHDYMVGAQLEGYEQMVSITDAPVIILEGDEYLSSPMDRRPKFHLYKPHVALLTGIAWDHINVFPTFDNYLEQFSTFTDLIEPGGSLIYFEQDEHLRNLAAAPREDLTYIPYTTPEFTIENNQTIITVNGERTELNVFGKHNLENLVGAMEVCRQLGVEPAQFLEAIKGFKGAAKRLELIGESDSTVFYKDFAHAPSKLKATISALKEQYPNRKLTACIELHTYSSLNKEFMEQYKDTMSSADTAVVYYNPHTLEMKRLPDIEPAEVKDRFGAPGVDVFTQKEALLEKLRSLDWQDNNLLMMSSGTFDGIDFDELGTFVLSS